MPTAIAECNSGGRSRWIGRQFHNQPAQSHLHRFLVDLWADVAAETDGQVAIAVHPQNGGVAGSDPQVLDMARSGEVEFITLMGGILARAVPVAEIQGLPFAFKSTEQVQRIFGGPLGDYLTAECRRRGLHRFRQGLLENGFRHISTVDKPIRSADDLSGVRLRVPDSQIFRDLFTTLEAEPATVNISELYDALRTRRVDGQENPLVVTEYNKLYEVTRYVSLTAHMWSGFNLLGNLAFWSGLPDDIQGVIEASVRRQVSRQRAFTDRKNRQLAETLAFRGMVINAADTQSFRRKLGAAFYRRWKGELGATAWALLESEIGTLP